MIPPPAAVPGFPAPWPQSRYEFAVLYDGRDGGEQTWTVPASGVTEVGVVLRSYGWAHEITGTATPYMASDMLVPSLPVTAGDEFTGRLGGAPALLTSSAGDSGGGPGSERVIIGAASGGFNGGGAGYMHTAMDPPLTLSGGETTYALTSAGFGATELRDPDGRVVAKAGGGGGFGASRGLSVLDYPVPWDDPMTGVASAMPAAGAAPRVPRSGVIFPALPGLTAATVDVAGISGGLADGGGSVSYHDTDPYAGYPFDVVSGAGGGGYGGGASGPVAVRSTTPPAAALTTRLTVWGKWGGNYVRPALDAVMASAVPSWPEIPSFSGGGFVLVYWAARPRRWRFGRLGWGHDRW